MFGEVLMSREKEKTPSFREGSAGVWKRVVGEALLDKRYALLDEVVETIASSENPLYSYTRDSKFREKIEERAVLAIDELVKSDTKNYAEPIDMITRDWPKEIGESQDVASEEKAKGQSLAEKLVLLAGNGNKKKLVEQIIQFMIEEEKRQNNMKDTKTVQ